MVEVATGRCTAKQPFWDVESAQWTPGGILIINGCNAARAQVLTFKHAHGVLRELSLEQRHFKDTLTAPAAVSSPAGTLTAMLIPPWGIIAEPASGRILFEWPCGQLVPEGLMGSMGRKRPPDSEQHPPIPPPPPPPPPPPTHTHTHTHMPMICTGAEGWG